MRVVRFVAVVGSLILLVATSVSVFHRRGDVRDSQEARVELASSQARVSVRASLARIRQEVALTARAALISDDSDAALLADELAGFVPGSDVCVGSDVFECTDEPLLVLDEVSDLATRSAADFSESDPASTAVAAVDAASETVTVVRQIIETDRSATVALRLPVDELLGGTARLAIEAVDAEIQIVPQNRTATDVAGTVELIDGRRVVTDVIGSAFVSGSVELTSSVEGDVGLAGDRTARYLALLAMGTVLLALAGWTFLVERRQLERRATTDELTDLINRREFERVSEDALDMADRFSTGLCVMVIDLNGFKQINDRLGHQFGDLVLTAAAERFVDAVRDTDVVGRWGGDEFVILLPGLSERTAVRNSAERIWNRLASSPVVGDITITASIGAAIFPRHGTTLDALMRAADVAMYEAKTTGVSHRIADTIAVGDSLLSPDGSDAEPLPSADPEIPSVVTDGYAGPDRRRSPVPPPPPLPDPDAVGDDPDDPGSSRGAGSSGDTGDPDDPGDLAPPSGARRDEPSVQ